ncbi:MAG: vWA domain-containing protein [Myxococcaceae bacterium]|nr:vWA domain-containing protein [Myxococcaceae bacterium]
MLAERLQGLQERLASLKAGEVPALPLFERLRALVRDDDGQVLLEPVHTLHKELERVGVHTSADARLLRELGQAKGRLGELSRGLLLRAEEALSAMEAALREAERLVARGKPSASLVSRLEVAFTELARIVKVAAIFSAPEAAPFELLERPARPGQAPASPRLALAEFYAERARVNTQDTAQKRKDLDLAHEILLRMSTDEKGDRERMRRLRVEVSEARDRVRLAPVVRSLDELVKHLRHVARRDPKVAWRSMRALYERAVEAGDARLAEVAQRGLEALRPRGREVVTAMERNELRRMLNWREPAQTQVAESLAPGGNPERDPVDDMLTQLAFDLDENQRRALELAAGCARFFDIEDTLSEQLIEAELGATRPVQRKVSYPTQVMTYEFTNSLDQVHNFVITQPGSLMLELAAGRQMVRQYLEEEPPPRPRKVMKTAVRVYVLDASGSMHGARARFRDAILISELNAIRVKAKQGLPFDPLYFSFFNDAPTRLVRVDSGQDATHHIGSLFRTSPAEGQTDITLALMSAFDSIRTAQGRDPYLARATVVLVTDGEDGVDLELIRRTRKPFEGLDIALSFISLGEENVDLKSLILEQRNEGGRAFYHHLSDQEIKLARTEFDSAWRTLLPADVTPADGALEALLPHLEALEALAAGRPVRAPERLDAQFDTFFPPSPQRPASAPLAPRLADLLDAVAEAASLAPAETRAQEAVMLLVHLLGLYEVTTQRYLEEVGADLPALVAARKRVRLLCRPFA